MMEHQAEIPVALELARHDVVCLLDGQHLASHHPDIPGHGGNAEDDGEIADSTAKNSRKSHRQDHLRDCTEHFRESRDDVVNHPTEITGNHAQHRSDGTGNTNGKKTHNQADPGAIDDPTQDIAAITVGPQPVFLRRSRKGCGEIRIIRIVRSKKWSEKSHQHEQHHDNESDQDNTP